MPMCLVMPECPIGPRKCRPAGLRARHLTGSLSTFGEEPVDGGLEIDDRTVQFRRFRVPLFTSKQPDLVARAISLSVAH